MNSISQRADVSEFRKRYKWMTLVVLFCVLVLFGRLVIMQVFQHATYHNDALQNVVHSIGLPTSRGVIRDRNGTVLAASRESWNVYVTPAYLDFEHAFTQLAEILNLGPVERAVLEKKLRQIAIKDWEKWKTHQKERKKEFFHFEETLVREDVHRDIISRLRTHTDAFRVCIEKGKLTTSLKNCKVLNAINWALVPMRWYPFPELTFHTLGYVSEINSDDLNVPENRNVLRANDRVGRNGVEKAWEHYLRGSRGWRKAVVDAHGNHRTAPEDLALLAEPREQLPTPGRDLRLTLDLDIMKVAKKGFAEHESGGLVMVEVNTGRVLAMYSKPSTDNNLFVSGLSKAQYAALENNDLRPLSDKTVFETFFPGSVMKPFTALAALARGTITPTTEEECQHIYRYGKREFKCHGGTHGDISLRRALAKSCNIYFYRVGQRTGLDHMTAMTTQFGFGQRSGIGINYEQPGLIPTTAWYTQHFGQYQKGFALNAAIGQGNTKITLIQLAMAYAALANKGTLYAPQLIQSIENHDGQVEVEFQPRIRRQIPLALNHLNAVLDGMHAVVHEEGGTAYKHYLSRYTFEMAGKTGTAQVSRVGPDSDIPARRIDFFNADHAWFAGFAPYHNPEVAVVALVEHGGLGGAKAAPIVMNVLNEYFSKIKPAHAQRKALNSSNTKPPNSPNASP